MPVGTDLRQARERAGLSAEQIAERTKIQLHNIEALENDNFEQLPAGIYLDGILRAYAHEVGIDPEPLIARVRDERAIVARDRQVAAADLEAFPFEGDVKNDEAARTIGGLSSVATTPERPVVSAAAPKEIDLALPMSQPEPARQARGLGGVLLPMVLLLVAVGLVAYFYHATGRIDRDTTPDIVASSPRPASPDGATSSQQPKAPEGMKADASTTTVESSDRISTPAATADASTTSSPTVASSDRNPTPAEDQRDANVGAGPRESAAARIRPTESPSTTTAPATPESAGTAGSAKDVSGAWTLATHVESSSYAGFEGLNLGYEIQLEQSGNRVKGSGRKVTENGDGIGSQVQTPISVAGTIDGDRLTLTFTERGARRPTQGKFVLLLEESGTLRGRFSSTAAQSSGTVEAHRLSR